MDQLAAALASRSLPKGARAMGERVLERLSSPVCVAVLGRPDAGLAATVNALFGGDVLPDRPGLPPVEVTFGAEPQITIVTSDGREERIDRDRFDQLDLFTLAMVRLSTPLPLLDSVSFLVVPLEGDAQSVEAAIGWTARRADMVVWCVSELVEPERAFWRRLPETLMDHAYLAVTREPRQKSAPVGQPALGVRFRGVHFLGRGMDHAARLTGFRSDLLEHVATARREDLEGALVFLDRYQPDGIAVPEPPLTKEEPVRADDPPDFSDLLDTADRPSGAGRSSAGGVDITAEIISFLSAQACELSCLCDASESETVQTNSHAVLGLCAESIDACNEMAVRGGGPVEAILAEASDLMLLMQLEATPDAMSDAVALVLQVRHECEALLCA